MTPLVTVNLNDIFLSALTMFLMLLILILLPFDLLGGNLCPVYLLLTGALLSRNFASLVWVACVTPQTQDFIENGTLLLSGQLNRHRHA